MCPTKKFGCSRLLLVLVCSFGNFTRALSQTSLYKKLEPSCVANQSTSWLYLGHRAMLNEGAVGTYQGDQPSCQEPQGIPEGPVVREAPVFP